jgi:hypothetical protein
MPVDLRLPSVVGAPVPGGVQAQSPVAGALAATLLTRSPQGYSAMRETQPGLAKALQTIQAACCGQNFGGSVAGLRTP